MVQDESKVLLILIPLRG